MPETKNGLFASLGKHRFIMAALLAFGAALIAFALLGAGTPSDDERTRYEKTLEDRLEKLCLSVAGVDEAKVLVTVDGSFGENTSRYFAANSQPTVRGAAVVVSRGDDPALRRTVTELVASSLGIPTSRVSVAPFR